MHCSQMERFKKKVLLGSNHVGIELETKLKLWDKEKKKCRVDVVASQIINNYNKSMGEDNILIVLLPIPFKSKLYSRIPDLVVINSWIIVNSRLSDDENHSSTSHRKLRLFHLKYEIAKFLLIKTNIQIVPTATVRSSKCDEESKLPTKKLCEANSTVTNVIRYDNSNH